MSLWCIEEFLELGSTPGIAPNPTGRSGQGSGCDYGRQCADPMRAELGNGLTYSLHCSSFLGLPFRILNIDLVKAKKGTTMETMYRV